MGRRGRKGEGGRGRLTPQFSLQSLVLQVVEDEREVKSVILQPVEEEEEEVTPPSLT